MTQKTLTTSDIIGQKLDHIKYFSDDGIHEAFLVGIARDACYTANNSVQFKKKQLADKLAEYDRKVHEEDEYGAERCKSFAGRLKLEKEILEERLEIEKAVYFTLTGGEEWSPAPKRPVARKSDIDMEAIRAELAA
jgi:hypothetical protein